MAKITKDTEKYFLIILIFIKIIKIKMLQVKKLSSSAKLPTRATSGSAGYDLYATMKLTISSGERSLVHTDLAIMLPEGTYGQIVGRSGLALRGIDIFTGTIDSDYRGNLGILVINNSGSDFTIGSGDRIAQLIVQPYLAPDLNLVEELAPSNRIGGK